MIDKQIIPYLKVFHGLFNITVMLLFFYSAFCLLWTEPTASAFFTATWLPRSILLLTSHASLVSSQQYLQPQKALDYIQRKDCDSDCSMRGTKR